ncbi:hypothetical protein NIES2101_12710 [Calothrix sp. HK-06]|nr:hypothetical protein NIES2101_12710 [Calothrix sp. HK-06]
MSDDWHLTVYSRKKQMVLGILAKRILETSPEWAAEYRYNILSHDILPNPPYLLFAFPCRLYLWKNSDASVDNILPNYNIDAYPILKPYSDKINVELEHIYCNTTFEFIVESWLGKIMDIKESPSNLDTSEQWLIESGLYTAIKGGKFATQLWREYREDIDY